MPICNPEKRRDGIDRPKPFVIPVFLPHRGCPHRCVFCNQHVIADVDRGLSPRELPAMIERWLGYRGPRRAETQISFFGGNFLGLPPDVAAAYLASASRYVREGRADSLRFSTRPDTIDARRLDMIQAFPVRTVELGVQSMDNAVLQRCRRGHSREDTVRAVKQLRKRGYEVGLQLMIGLPGDTEAGMIETARAIVALKPAFIRIYPTLVLAGSRLAGWYTAGRYQALELDRSVAWVKRLFLFFHHHRIPVARMGLQSSAGLADDRTVLSGPYHPCFGHLVYAAVFFEMAHRLLSRAGCSGRTITLHVNPGSVSKLAGLKNQNIHRLCDEFGLCGLRIQARPALAPDRLMLDDGVEPMSFDQLEVT
jgi:histone acetyltransferase (RNA polymerase elongator complex component)